MLAQSNREREVIHNFVCQSANPSATAAHKTMLMAEYG